MGERTDFDSGWEALAEWTGGLAPEQIQSLAAVRPLEAVHSLLRGLTGRNPRELLARAAVVEALASQPSSGINPDEAWSWLTEPARGETLRALVRSGWLEPGPGSSGETFLLTRAGRQLWDALRRSVFAEPAETEPASRLLPDGITPEQIVRALLTRSLAELAEVGRESLVPVIPAPPLLNTRAVAVAAEAQATANAGSAGNVGNVGNAGDAQDTDESGEPGGHRRR
jgi:hypothetical protein